MKRSRMVRLAAAIVLLAVLNAPELPAQPAGEPQATSPADGGRFEALAARYRQILQRRPRRGTAFDLWYRHYFDAGRLDELLDSVESAAREQPEDSAAQLLLGLVLERQGRDDAAVAAYSAAEKLASEDYYPPYARGTLLARRNELERAVEALARALELKPPRTEALDIAKALGRVQFRRGETEQALRTWEEVVAQFPKDRQVLEELAGLLAQQEQYDEAIRRWEQVAELVRDDPAGRLQTQIEIAELHVRKGGRNTAVEMFGEALERLSPESWQAQDVRRRIENAFLRDEDVAGLVQWCEGQLQRRPEDLGAMLQLARAQGIAGRRDDALQTYERAVRLAPSRKEIREALIAELVRKRDFAQAVAHGEELAGQHPTDADVLRRLGELYLEAADPEGRAQAEKKAVEVWKRIAAIRPEDAALALQTAECCRRATRARWPGEEPSPLVATAEQFYREAIRRSSGAPHYHEYLGEFLHEQGRKDEARAAWAKIAAPPNETAENWHRLAEVYARFDALDEALRASEQSLALDPQNFRFCDDRIRLLLRAKHYDEALRLLPELQRLADDAAREEQATERTVEAWLASGRVDEKIAELRGRFEHGGGTLDDRLLLALLLIEQRAAGPARDTVAAALKSAPDDVRFLRLHAALLQEAEDRAGAVRTYTRLVELDPQRRAEHYERIVQLELDRRRPAAAKSAADRLVELSPSNLDAYRLRARVAFQTNDPADGLAALRRAVQTAPRDLDIRIELARALAEHQQEQEAVEHFWRGFELADSSDEKRSVIATMAELSRDVLPRADLIARLEQLRARSQDSKVLTLCLVEAHRRAKQFEPARRELLALLSQRRDDLDVLRHLVELAEEQKNWSDAAAWQEDLIEFDPDPRNLEKLGRLYAQAAGPSKAIDVWLRLLREHGDDRPMIGEIDRRLAAGDFSTAATLAERALQVAPGNWALHHRAGCARYTLQQWDHACAHFENVLTLTSSPARPSDPIRQLEAATAAHQRIEALRQFRRAQARTPINRTPRRVPQLQASFSDVPFEARLDSLTALYLLSGRSGGPQKWTAERRKAIGNDADQVRDLILVLFSARNLATATDLIEDFCQQQPDDPLPHVARLLEPQDRRETALLAKDDRRRFLDGLHASFRWIAEHDPALKPKVLFNYGSRLNALGYSEETADLLLEELRTVQAPQDLEPLAELAVVTYQPGFREKFTLRAADLVASSKTPVGAGVLRALLDVAMMRGAIAPGAIDDELAGAAVLLFERYLTANLSGARRVVAVTIPTIRTTTSNSRVSIQYQAQPAATGALGGYPGAAMGGRSGIAVGSVHVSGSLRQAKVLLDYYKRQQTAITQMRGRSNPRITSTQIRQFEEQLERLLEQLTSLGFGENPEELLQEFPAAGPLLDAESFLALYRLRLWLDQAGKLDLLLQRLENPPADTAREQRRFAFARAFVLWWSDRREESIEIVRELSESAPDDGGLRIMLARAYYSDARLQEALAVLDSIENFERAGYAALADEVARLKADTARQISERTRLAVLRGHEHVVRAVAWAPDGRRLASASYDGTIRLWIDTQQPAATLEGHKEFVFCVAFSPDGKQLASAGIDGRIVLWNLTLLASGASLTGHEGGVRSLEFSADGQWLLSAGDDDTVRLWSVPDRSEVRRLEDHPPGVVCAAFSPDGKSIATGGTDGAVRLWNAASGELTETLKAHSTVVRSLGFSPDGKLLATGSDDNTAKLWDLPAGQLRAELSGHTDTVFDISFTPDGKRAVTASGDRTVRLWNVESGRLSLTLTGHTNAVSSARVSPDGRRLASGSYDRTVRLWRIE